MFNMLFIKCTYTCLPPFSSILSLFPSQMISRSLRLLNIFVTGDKLLCWSIIFALAGANWGAALVYYFRFILSDRGDFCEEIYSGNKREVTTGNWDSTYCTRSILNELKGPYEWGIICIFSFAKWVEHFFLGGKKKKEKASFT